MWKKLYKEDIEDHVDMIDTGLGGGKVVDILNSVIGQMSDGMWENSPVMEHYWPFIDIDEENGGVYFSVSIEPWKRGYRQDNWFYTKMNLDERKIKEFMANKLKAVAKQELKDDPDLGSWDRNNTNETGYLSYGKPITFQEVYFVYEILKGRDCISKYPDEVSDELLG